MNMHRGKRTWKFFIGLLIIGLLPLYLTDKAFADIPTAAISLSDSNLAIGETATVMITFSEEVSDLKITDLTVENATLSNLTNDNNYIWVALLTPAAGINNPTNVLQLNYDGNVIQTINYSIDTVKPTVTGVSVPASGYYRAGNMMTFVVNMSESVTVAGTPSIALDIGGTVVQAAYLGGSGSAALLFSYTVQAGLTDTDGIAAEALSLNSGSIKDNAGNDADLTLKNVGITTGIKVDSKAPQVISVAVPIAASYKAGDSLAFTVTMSENITVTGTPQLTLNIGGVSRAALYAGTESNNLLHFTYIVQSGDSDSDGISVGALSLNGGSTITDALGNAADLTLNGVGNTSNVDIDTAAPTITGHSSLGEGNAYIDVMFSEGVYAANNGTGALTTSDLGLNFNPNGGSASEVSIVSLKTTDGNDLIGGESVIRVMLDVTGTPNGEETIEVVPATGASIYDRAGNALGDSQSSGTATLLDMRAPFISPASASFDKYAGAAENGDVTTTLTLYSNTLTGIANGSTPLVSGTDYTVAGNEVTIKTSYLAAQPEGTTNLTFTFSAGPQQTLAITVSDSTPAPVTPPPPPPPTPTPTPAPALALDLPVIDQNGVTLDPASVDIAKPSVTLQVTPIDGAAYVSIPAGILASFEDKNATFSIEIKTPYASYQVPVNLASLMPGLQDLLAKNNLTTEDVSFKIALTDKSGDKNIQTALATGLPDGKVMGAIVDFHIDIINAKTGQSIGTADKFNQALTRVIPMPKSMTDMPEQWGAFRYNEKTKQFEFVPAKKVQIDGVWYVMISSYSNSIYVVAENEANFTDVQKHWAQPFVELAAAKGLVDGVGGGKYAPDKAVTRAEFAAMLVRALGRGASTGSTSPYDDVKPGAWYFDEISKAKELGLLDFVNGQSFKPDQPLTREEMASMLAQAVALEKLPITKEYVSLDAYEDIGSVDDAYLEGVSLMVKLQIMTGTDANSFSPKGETTRAQAAVVLIRITRALGMTD